MANGKTLVKTETMPEEPLEQAGGSGDILQSGKAIQRAGTPFVTAISVQKPRNLDAVVKALTRECEYGGESFYYSIAFGGARVEGASIGLAQAIAREWGNCAVTSEVQETDDSFLFLARFVDLERGFQIERAFRQRKDGQVAGRFDSNRKLDIAFQIGQSKATRNVICNAIPRWLVDRCIELAKDAVAKKITPEGLEKAKQTIIDAFKKYRVTEEMLVAKLAKPRAEWTTRDIADLTGDGKAIASGEMSVVELFPPADTAPQAGPVTMDAALTGKVKVPHLPPAAPVNEDSEPSPEEQEAIRQREIAEEQGQAPAKAAAPAAKRNSLF
jgi:hypothetical protein